MATLNLGLVIYLIYLIIKMGKAVDKIGEKADKIELNKIGKKLEELESENISIIEKIVNGASKEEIKSKGLISEWAGKIRNNCNFRIIGQGREKLSYGCFIIPIRDGCFLFI